MTTSLSSMKGEHVISLKEDFERVCNDKIQLQIKVAECEERITKSYEKIEGLVEVNNDLRTKIKIFEGQHTAGDDFELPDVSF